MSVLRLAIPSPLRRQFDYLPPAGLEEAQIRSLQPGVRLRVPFGRRELTGYLLEVCSDSDLPPESLKPALEILDLEPLIDPQLLQLALWASSYYHHPAGEVISSLFPKRLRDGKQRRIPGVPAWRLTTRGKGLGKDALPRSPRQAQAIAALAQTPVITAELLKDSGISDAVLRSLRSKGLIEPCTLAPQATPVHSREGLTLNPEQEKAFQALVQAGDQFSCHLLEGVTGSGKTEVYLQLIEQCIQRGKQALVLVPEIGLTPQTLSRFSERFAANIAVLHSGMGDARRYAAWEEARAGRAQIVIGTRSAIFTPLKSPGLLIVDEEHDGSYKQQDGFRYSARDVAVKRGQLLDCPVILGSATPSLESIHNAVLGRYHHHTLSGRAGSGRLPSLEALDVRRQQLQGGLAPQLLDTIEEHLLKGQQALLFLNRRGYAPTLQCHDCGWIAECRSCDARLTVHRRQRRLRCHHCGSSTPLQHQCPQCHSTQLMTTGLGTEQTEDYLRSRFDKWPVYRVDSDSMQARDAMRELTEEINSGKPCILLGTQMLTKGHHFPNVSLVIVIDTDAMLFNADFRGEERMAQLLTQVAGRAGRAELPGNVVLQTHYPDHPALLAILHSSYGVHAREMLKQRQAAGMPPAGHLVLMRTDSPEAETGERFLQALRQQCTPGLPQGSALIGPLPSPMQRRAGMYRCQLLLTARNRNTAQAAATLLVTGAEHLPTRKGLKWSIDVDPQDVF